MICNLKVLVFEKFLFPRVQELGYARAAAQRRREKPRGAQSHNAQATCGPRLHIRRAYVVASASAAAKASTPVAMAGHGHRYRFPAPTYAFRAPALSVSFCVCARSTTWQTVSSPVPALFVRVLLPILTYYYVLLLLVVPETHDANSACCPQYSGRYTDRQQTSPRHTA